MTKKYVILDTDWGSDVDDVVAARLLCNAHKQGKIEFLGCILDAVTPDSVRSLDAFLLHSGLDLPIGIDRDNVDFISDARYQNHLTQLLPSKYKSEDEAEGGVRLYRRLLANAPEKVHIVAIGFKQVMADLLESGPDDLSPLNGRELVREKVAHLWDMGGRWDGIANGEYNFNASPRSVSGSHRLCKNWTAPITFLGWEVGDPVITGGDLPDDDPLKQSLIKYGCPEGRSSWDPMTALLCVIGDPAEAGYDCVTGYASSSEEDGSCSFQSDPAGPHRYVIKKHPDEWYAAAVNACLPWSPVLDDKQYWQIVNEGKAIRWTVDAAIPHMDHVETSGKETALVIYYGVKADGTYTQELHCIFPMLRLIPNKTHASLQVNLKNSGDDETNNEAKNSASHGMIPTGVLPAFEVGGAPLAEYPVDFTFDGVLTVRSRTNVPGLQVIREIAPADDAPVNLIRFTFVNEGKEAVEIRIINNHVQVASRGARGVYLVDCDMQDDSLTVPAESENGTALVIHARTADQESRTFDPAAELAGRRKRMTELTSPLQLETGIAELDTMFHFCKIRAGESIFRTRGGFMHGPGGESYYAATWCNDEVEYAGPWFAWTGDALALDASFNAYRHYMPFMGPDYYPIPSSVISEAFDIWEGAGDRGDGAMWAYGASRFALTCGDREIAKQLWRGIEWCLEYCRRRKNPQGVVMSDKDEMEGRFPSGSANLCTSSLYYGALLSAAALAEEFQLPEKAAVYRRQAEQLALDMESYFGAEIHGFKTYRYYDGNTTLRSWIGIPLCMGILNRAEDTVAALYSDYLWFHDGMLCEEGGTTYWDRSLLYGLRGAFAAGEVEQTFRKLLVYSRHRLLGDHVPYPIEAWPEGGKRHLSAESALYCRVITEGLLGFVPLSFNSFRAEPRIPAPCNAVKLKNIRAFGSVFDLIATREQTVVCCNGVEKVYPAGQIIVDLASF